MFRKVGGFVYVMSTLVSMEGCLADGDKPWRDGISQSDVLRMLHLVFNTLCIAMRYEPANAKFFHLEVICNAFPNSNTVHDFIETFFELFYFVLKDLRTVSERHGAIARLL